MVLLPLFLKEVVRTGTISIFFFFQNAEVNPKSVSPKEFSFVPVTRYPQAELAEVGESTPSRNRHLSSYDVANGFGPQDASVLPLLADGLFLFTH